MTFTPLCAKGALRIVSLPFFVTVVALSIGGGCWQQREDQLIVYTALDREFSEPILQGFTRETGIQVAAVYDLEANKTVGLANRILRERHRPRCNVFWNNEILNTLRLQEEGLLDIYVSPQARHYPSEFQSDDFTWYGFAARARVLLVNTQIVSPEDYPQSILDLANPRWKDRVGLAKPLFGTTATHAACLFDFWGPEQAKEFFLRVRDNAKVKVGNKQVAQAVSGGELAFGLTDTDDAIIEIENGFPVKIVYPDQGDEAIGTLFIPNTVSILRSHQDHEAPCRLIDYLLTREVEIKLARGRSAQIPLHNEVDIELRLQNPKTVKAMKANFIGAAEQWDGTARFLRRHFVNPD